VYENRKGGLEVQERKAFATPAKKTADKENTERITKKLKSLSF